MINQNKTLKTKKKLRIIVFGFLCCLLIITAKLFYLQGHLFDRLFIRSQKNFLRTEPTDSLRGNIFDHNGELLATNRPTHNIFWQGSGNQKLSQEQISVLNFLEITLQKKITCDSYLKTIKRAEKYFKKELISPDISFEELSKIIEQFPLHPNLIVDTSVKRFYPHKNIASHVVGYLGAINYEATGKMGIEKLFNDSLKGESGELLRTINSLGRNLKEKEIKKALAGQDLHLTLDLKLQKLAEKHFPETKKGAFILMDSFSGALKVIVSRPSFNPNIFLDSIISNDWKKIQETQPFINRAFDSCYPPASIFKLITVSAALEEKIITQDSTWNCKGFFRFGKSNLRCRAKHGSLTTELAVAHSCNILFYEIGKRMNIDTLAHYAHTFGLGKKTNILFSEKKGLIPTYNWKIEYKGERWWKGETLSVAIGQSFLLTTPIQIARMVASIASGSLVNPRILEKETIIKQPLKISEKTRAFLNQSMRTASTEGTGKRLNNIENLTIFAKTGSAQTSELSKRKLGDKYLEHGWFVANIFYKNEKPITLVVIVENAGGSRIPVNITKKFLIEYSKLMQDEERKNS